MTKSPNSRARKMTENPTIPITRKGRRAPCVVRDEDSTVARRPGAEAEQTQPHRGADSRHVRVKLDHHLRFPATKQMFQMPFGRMLAELTLTRWRGSAETASNSIRPWAPSRGGSIAWWCQHGVGSGVAEKKHLRRWPIRASICSVMRRESGTSRAERVAKCGAVPPCKQGYFRRRVGCKVRR